MPRSRRQDTVKQHELNSVVSWLKSLREMNNLTQNDFANRIGVSTTYVNMLYQKKRKPSIQLLKRIADIFNDTETLRSILPRAYETPSFTGHRHTLPEQVLNAGSPLSSIFNSLNHQPVVSTGNFLIDEVNDRSLESWGVYSPCFSLSEQVTQADLTAGDLVVYGERNNRKWGFVHSVGSETFIISGGLHLRELLRLTDSEWVRSGLHHLDVNQYLLKEYFDRMNVCKTRLILNLPPNLRTPIVSHPSYQFLKPVDRHVVDQVITRFTGYARGETGYQPSQHPQKF